MDKDPKYGAEDFLLACDLLQLSIKMSPTRTWKSWNGSFESGGWYSSRERLVGFKPQK